MHTLVYKTAIVYIIISRLPSGNVTCIRVHTVTSDDDIDEKQVFLHNSCMYEVCGWSVANEHRLMVRTGA